MRKCGASFLLPLTFQVKSISALTLSLPPVSEREMEEKLRGEANKKQWGDKEDKNHDLPQGKADLDSLASNPG